MFDTILGSPLAFMASVFVLSLCIGSFLNVVAYRLPIMMRRQVEADYLDINGEEPKELPAFNLNIHASACPKRKSKIKPWQNNPDISYLMTKAK